MLVIKIRPPMTMKTMKTTARILTKNPNPVHKLDETAPPIVLIVNLTLNATFFVKLYFVFGQFFCN
jgi:hypothetical protein